MTVLSAAQTGDEVATLEAMRDTLALAMDAAMNRGDGTVAQLNAQLAKVLERLSDLKPSGKVTLHDELISRRVARAGGAESAAPAAGKVQRAG